MPLAQISGFVQPKRLANWTPHSIGGDDVPGSDAQAIGGDNHMVVVLFDRSEGDAIAHLNTRIAGKLNERVVQLSPRRHRGVSPGTSEGDLDRAARRGPQRCACDVEPVDDRSGIEVEMFEFAQRQCGQTITAALVSRERRPIDQHDRPTRPSELDSGSRTRGPTTDDQDICRKIRGVGRAGHSGQDTSGRASRA